MQNALRDIVNALDKLLVEHEQPADSDVRERLVEAVRETIVEDNADRWIHTAPPE